MAHVAAKERRLWLTLGLPSVVTTAVFAFGFEQSDLDCEDAVAHLVHCCPNLDPHRFDCTTTYGCTGGTSPQYDPATSQCLAKLDCSHIQGAGLCDTSDSTPPLVSRIDAQCR